jgi:hypothetical protein
MINVFLPTRMMSQRNYINVAFRDHGQAELFWRGTEDVHWTFIRPRLFTDDEPKEVTIYGEEGTGIGCLPGVSHKSIVVFVVTELSEIK